MGGPRPQQHLGAARGKAPGSAWTAGQEGLRLALRRAGAPDGVASENEVQRGAPSTPPGRAGPGWPLDLQGPGPRGCQDRVGVPEVPGPCMTRLLSVAGPPGVLGRRSPRGCQDSRGEGLRSWGLAGTEQPQQERGQKALPTWGLVASERPVWESPGPDLSGRAPPGLAAWAAGQRSARRGTGETSSEAPDIQPSP